MSLLDHEYCKENRSRMLKNIAKKIGLVRKGAKCYC